MTTKITLNNIADTALATLTGPKVTTIVYPGDDTATDIAGGVTINLTGNGFQSGCSVLVASTASSVVTFISATQISFIAPALAAGTYVIYVINPDGGTAISIPGISYSGTPNWSTAAGTLGTVYETGSISSTLTAVGDDPITYTLASGTLPPGSTLTSDGTLSGTAQATASATTYSFTISANDAQNQTTNRSFSLTINPDVVTWSSPDDNTIYTTSVDQVLSNVALSASSAAGGSITYTADSLPTGLSISGANIAGTPTVSANTTTVLTATSTATRTATRTINWVVSVANDPFFNSTTLLLPGNATTFVQDASANNFPITIAGDTRPNSFGPYTPGYYSNYFDGTGDDLSTTLSASIGTSDFTFEAWVYRTSTSTDENVIVNGSGNSGGWGMAIDGQKLRARVNTTNLLFSTSNIPTGAWTHCAISKQGSTVRLFVNGVQEATGTSTVNATATLLIVGNWSVGGSTYDFTGYLSNVRVVVGFAVYTANFTPPTQPLAAVEGTALLTCQSNRFIDNSTNNYAITRTGNTRIDGFDPFVPATEFTGRGSAYFDGTGDSLTVPPGTPTYLSSDLFTIEAWVYPNADNGVIVGRRSAVAARGFFLGYGTGVGANRFSFWAGDTDINTWNLQLNSTNTFPLNQWYHVAATRSSGNVFTLWVNGVSEAAGTSNFAIADDTANLQIGIIDTSSAPLNGYISNLRIVKGTAVYTTANFTPPSAPLTAVAGTSLLTLQNNQPVNNSTFLDSSSNNLLVTRAGNATQGTFSPYSPSGWSNYFDGTGDYLSIPDSDAWISGAGSFTIETWIYPIGAGSGRIYSQYPSGSDQISIQITSGQIRFFVYSSTTFQIDIATGAGAISANAWNHIAVVRNGTSFVIYVNGVSRATATSSYNIPNLSAALAISSYAGTTEFFTGYLSNYRIIKGTAVYTAAFTPSTTPLTAIAGTSLLTCADNRFADESPNNFAITRNGDTRVTNWSPFKAVTQTPVSYSAYFDGNNDYITPAAGAAFTIGTGDFTYECWVNRQGVNPISAGNALTVFDTRTAEPSIAPCLFWENDAMKYYVNGANRIVSTSTFPIGTWAHIAIVRLSGVTKMYVNGVQEGGNYTDTNNYVGTVTNIGGRFAAVSGDFRSWFGYMSNARIVKGTAVYPANFTPPTVPLTAVAGTSFLTCQSATFEDNSTNRFVITATGNSQPTTINPFGSTFTNSTGYTAAEYGGSTYFDGTGDSVSASLQYLPSVLGVAFTVEFWLYLTRSSSPRMTIFNCGNMEFNIDNINLNQLRFDMPTGQINVLNSGTARIDPFSWNHVALSRSAANSYSLYLNGIKVGTGASGTAINPLTSVITSGMQSYVSNFRAINGVEAYTSNFVPPLAPVQSVPNTTLLLNGTGAAIADATTKNVLETVGDARISTAVAKFGGSSMYFDGTGDYLIAPASNLSTVFGTGDFTVELWVNRLNGTRIVEFSTGLLYLDGNGKLVYYSTSARITSTNAFPSNQWVHVALVRSAGSSKLYIDGVQTGSTFADTINYTSGVLIIGTDNGTKSNFFTGYMQDLRITRGVARYTADFTPPTTAFIAK